MVSCLLPDFVGVELNPFLCLPVKRFAGCWPQRNSEAGWIHLRIHSWTGLRFHQILHLSTLASSVDRTRFQKLIRSLRLVWINVVVRLQESVFLLTTPPVISPEEFLDLHRFCEQLHSKLG